MCHVTTIFKAITRATYFKSPTPPLTILLCLNTNMAKDPTYFIITIYFYFVPLKAFLL